jgi:hypothetical protein
MAAKSEEEIKSEPEGSNSNKLIMGICIAAAAAIAAKVLVGGKKEEIKVSMDDIIEEVKQNVK